MSRPAQERNSIDPHKLPPMLRKQLEGVLPPALLAALYAGSHEADFLLATEALMKMSIINMDGHTHPAFNQAYFRVREARVHLAEFSMDMEEAQSQASKPTIEVATAMPPERPKR